jgi:hypothetical protein
MSAGQAPNPIAQQGQAAAQSSAGLKAGTTPRGHGVFTVELTKALNSKKLRRGDQVEAKLTGSITLPSGAIVPRGANVLGHITEAEARSKNDAESALGIVFDRIAPPEGRETPIKGIILAAAPNPNPRTGARGITDSYINLAEATSKSAVSTLRQPSIPLLNDDSRGVLGIENLQLRPDGVFTFSGAEVKLISGTRMLLGVTVQ